MAADMLTDPGSSLFGGTGSDFMPKGSQNQFFSQMPSLPQTAPGIVPAASQPGTFQVGGPTSPFRTDVGSGVNIISPQDPALTSGLERFLQTQLGQGATPFDLATLLPSGSTTQPGQVNAPLNNIMQLLQKFFSSGTGGPAGASGLAEVARTGLPTDVGPAFEAMKSAAQRTIDEGRANLRESFSFAGNLAGSPFGHAATDFEAQTAKDLNAQLEQMSASTAEAAAGRKLTASDILTRDSASFATTLQGMDQQAIQNLMSEFIRTRPEYGPLLNMIFGLATTFPPTLTHNFGLGAAGAALQGAGTAAVGAADLIKALKTPQPAPTTTTTTPPTV